MRIEFGGAKLANGGGNLNSLLLELETKRLLKM
jgi:hypothetical protein